MIRDSLRPIIHRLVRNESFYSLLAQTVIPLAHAIENGHKRWLLESAIKQLTNSAMPIVRHGPFAGMLYPRLTAVGSALYPKLLGSYERELHAVFDEVFARSYTAIIDIGCAEGYYAVGLALRFPAAIIHAFDIEPEAIRLCEAMARANGVDDRLRTALACDPDKLLSIPLCGRALFVSDCEGYEKTLFSQAVVEHLRNHDVLIELHDFVDPAISQTIRGRFQATHEIQVIESVDDYHKALFYRYPEIQEAGFDVRRILLAENRPTIMQWFFAKGQEA